VNPHIGHRDTRGYCFAADQQGRPIVVELNEADCMAAGGVYDTRETREGG
jgi:hypothetical protein